jgi:hypothetical protein
MNRFSPPSTTTEVYDDPKKFVRGWNKHAADTNNPNSMHRRMNPFGSTKNFIYDPAASRKQLMNQ